LMCLSGARAVVGSAGSARFLYVVSLLSSFFFHDPATPEIYTLSLHDALPICFRRRASGLNPKAHRQELRQKHRAAHLEQRLLERDRKSTRLNSSHLVISYAVFCLKKKKKKKKKRKKNSK